MWCPWPLPADRSPAAGDPRNRKPRSVVVMTQRRYPDHELAHQGLDQARSPQRGPRLSPHSRVDDRSLLVLRVSEVVPVRGGSADSVYQQRPAAFIDVPRIRRPGSELVSRAVGVVVRAPLVPGILAQATRDSRGPGLLRGI